MKGVFNNIIETIGNTPMLSVDNFAKFNNLQSKIFVKAEMFNPFGSIKDRTALRLILDAIDQKKLLPNSTVIEATSGNTGIGLSGVCRLLGYKCVIVMPSNMSKERVTLLKSLGAEVILTDFTLGMQGAIDKAVELCSSIENSFMPKQFENKSNVDAHYYGTAEEIFNQVCDIDYIVCGIGTGGTITGIGKYFKERSKKTKIIGVEPLSSPFITKHYSAIHKIAGIGAGFIPKILDLSVVDEVIAVSDEDAYEYTRLLAKTENILAGISSGANMFASALISKRESTQKKIVAILHDGGERYMSTGIFDNI